MESKSEDNTLRKRHVEKMFHENKQTSEEKTPKNLKSEDVCESDEVMCSKLKTEYVMGQPVYNISISATQWWFVLGFVTVLSLISRLYRIEIPRQICWDETHFGKMGSYYINRTFFHDVHPPLGKMLIGLAGVLTGYEGNFSFPKPGTSYVDANINYVGMRMFCAILGSMLVPMMFVTVWELTKSLFASFLTSLLILCDVGFITLSRYILLDAPMMFFISLAAMATVKFRNEHVRPFSRSWWFWLTISGVGLAGSMGVKFVGLFIVLTVGFTTITDLWDLFGNLSYSLVHILKHFFARALCLIILPTMLYIAFFAIHYQVLKKSGPGDGFYSSWFQSGLENNTLHNASMPGDVMYGSVIALKQYRTGGAYLHSHWHLYPEGVGARQQQVTSYSHKDFNNLWIVKKFDRNPTQGEEPEPVKNGDIIRLEHQATKRNLHSHALQAPLTKKHYQVTCYGSNGTGDVNDLFRLEVDGGGEGEPIKALSTVFRLVHHNLGCAIYSHHKQLPKWGWEQMEVTCNPVRREPTNRWTVERIIDDRLPNVSFYGKRPGLFSKLLESHQVMFQSNSGLKPKEDEATSRPWHWPITYRGQPFCGPDIRVTLLGNPVLWWLNIVGICYYVLVYIYDTVRVQRGCSDKKETLARRRTTVSAGGWLLLGWFLHYAPFWAMSRVLYFHHYFPAAIFSFMLTGVMLHYFMCSVSTTMRVRLQNKIYLGLFAAAISGILYSFYLFYPLSYGVQGPNSRDPNGVMHGLRWLETWDF